MVARAFGQMPRGGISDRLIPQRAQPRPVWNGAAGRQGMPLMPGVLRATALPPRTLGGPSRLAGRPTFSRTVPTTKATAGTADGQAGVKRRNNEVGGTSSQGAPKVARTAYGQASASAQARIAANTASLRSGFVRTPQPLSTATSSSAGTRAGIPTGTSRPGAASSSNVAAASRAPWARNPHAGSGSLGGKIVAKPAGLRISSLARSLSASRTALPSRLSQGAVKSQPLILGKGTTRSVQPTAKSTAKPGTQTSSARALTARPVFKPQGAVATPKARTAVPSGTTSSAEKKQVIPGKWEKAQFSFSAASKLKRSGASTNNAESIKESVKLRKVEEFGRRLLHEWSSLTRKESQESAIKAFAREMAIKVPPMFLAMMAEQFNSACTPEAAEEEDTNEAAEPEVEEEEDEDVREEAEEEAEAEAEGYDHAADVKEEYGEVKEEYADEAVEGYARFSEVMQELLEQLVDLQQSEWTQAWEDVAVALSDRPDALAALIEAGASRGSTTDIVGEFIVELAKAKKVTVKNVEQAMKMAAGKLEAFIEVNTSAPDIFSLILTKLFPKTVHSQWGWPSGGWTWKEWWNLAESVLSDAGGLRSFDIMVRILTNIQENSKRKIREQQVWREEQGRRIQKVHQALTQWGEMDRPTVKEVLLQHGVELYAN